MRKCNDHSRRWLLTIGATGAVGLLLAKPSDLEQRQSTTPRPRDRIAAAHLMDPDERSHASISARPREALRDSRANIALDDLPDELPGAIINKHGFEGAGQLIIHIRNLHSNPDTRYLPEELDPARIDVQKEVRDILDFLIGQNALQRVYAEGANPGEETGLMRIIRSIISGTFFGGCMRRERDTFTCWFNLSIFKNQLHASVPQQLYANGKIQSFRFADDGDILTELDELAYEYRHLSWDSHPDIARLAELRRSITELTERREDIVISTIAEDGDVVSVLVFGGSHRFLDAVIRWNSQNPQDIISFCEITPTSFSKWERGEYR